MSKVKKYIFLVVAVIIIGALAWYVHIHKTLTPSSASKTSPAVSQSNSTPAPSPEKATAPKTAAPAAPTIKLVGPRQGLPAGAPAAYGFWSLAIPVPGVLSRSGQPTLQDFQWLRDNGWKSDIDLRIDGDHNEVSDDAKIPGFNALGFHYLKIQMKDGAAPTDQQAQTFLTFVTNPQNQPAEVHCRGGIGRAGVMVGLYRYAVQGWPLDKIFAESALFQGGIDAGQKSWLQAYAQAHAPGSWGK